MSNDNLPVSDSKLSTGEDVQAHIKGNLENESADTPFIALYDADSTGEDVQGHFARYYDAEGADAKGGTDGDLPFKR